jgi:hypothetical protein
MSACDTFDAGTRLIARAHDSVNLVCRFHQVFRARVMRLVANFAALRQDADFAARCFSAAMLRRSASIKLTTFSADGFIGAG